MYSEMRQMVSNFFPLNPLWRASKSFLCAGLLQKYFLMYLSTYLPIMSSPVITHKRIGATMPWPLSRADGSDATTGDIGVEIEKYLKGYIGLCVTSHQAMGALSVTVIMVLRHVHWSVCCHAISTTTGPEVVDHRCQKYVDAFVSLGMSCVNIEPNNPIPSKILLQLKCSDTHPNINQYLP